MATDTEKNIAANILSRMAIRSLTVKEVAALTEIPASTVYAVTKNETGISIDRLELFAKALHCSVADLVAAPVAISRPDVPTAWRVLKEFFDSLSAAKFRLLEAASALDDSEIVRYAKLMEAQAASASDFGGADERGADMSDRLSKKNARR